MQAFRDIKKELDREMVRHLDKEIREMEAHDPFITDILRYVKKIVLAGGKRVRPAMMQYGYALAGGTKKKAIIKASMSIEFAHTFILMHDDIIDRDDMRHGKKTLHAHYRDCTKILFGSEHDASHFGTSMGIIVGDYLHGLATTALYDSAFTPEKIVRALHELEAIVKRTVIGEIQDVVLGYKKKATEEEVLRMYENKTARYTFEGPLHLGAILAGADAHLLRKLTACAIPLGIGFQIQDDLLGIFGSSKKTGKPVGSDIAEGKMTLGVIYALNHGSRVEKKSLKGLLGKKNVTKKDVADFRKIIISTGARDAMHEKVKSFFSDARHATAALPVPEKQKQFLYDVIETLDKREG